MATAAQMHTRPERSSPHTGPPAPKVAWSSSSAGCELAAVGWRQGGALPTLRPHFLRRALEEPTDGLPPLHHMTTSELVSLLLYNGGRIDLSQLIEAGTNPAQIQAQAHQPVTSRQQLAGLAP